VPKESSRFGLPADKEHIVKLNADHNSVCRFGRSQIDEDNLELVEANIRDLCKQGLEAGELRKVQYLNIPDGPEGSSGAETDLKAHFANLKERKLSLVNFFISLCLSIQFPSSLLHTEWRFCLHRWALTKQSH